MLESGNIKINKIPIFSEFIVPTLSVYSSYVLWQVVYFMLFKCRPSPRTRTWSFCFSCSAFSSSKSSGPQSLVPLALGSPSLGLTSCLRSYCAYFSCPVYSRWFCQHLWLLALFLMESSRLKNSAPVVLPGLTRAASLIFHVCEGFIPISERRSWEFIMAVAFILAFVISSKLHT